MISVRRPLSQQEAVSIFLNHIAVRVLFGTVRPEARVTQSKQLRTTFQAIAVFQWGVLNHYNDPEASLLNQISAIRGRVFL